MKRYELLIAGALLSVSTLLKICAVVTLCHLNVHHLEETVHELVQVQDAHTQTNHLPMESTS